MDEYYKQKYLKYKIKYLSLKQILIGGSSNIKINLDNIYNNLLLNGFYDNIYIKTECSNKTSDNSIEIPSSCKNRISNIEIYKKIGLFNLYKSPCRIGRGSTYCSKNVKKCKIIDNNEKCPLCNIINSDVVSPCNPLNKIIRKHIDSSFPLIIIPNAYPYLEKQFLIVTPSHCKQIDSLKNKINISNLFSIFNTILTIGKDVIFFNGICGNSLEHFHCQYTTTKFPLFEKISETHIGLYNDEFRGYSIIISNNIDLFVECTNIIIENNLTYNFIARKVPNGLQIVLFIRHCIITSDIKDLNFGATELAGIIVSNEEITIDEEDIKKYIDATNRYIDYKKINSLIV
jgi:hypothetical protein